MYLQNLQIYALLLLKRVLYELFNFYVVYLFAAPQLRLCILTCIFINASIILLDNQEIETGLYSLLLRRLRQMGSLATI